MGLFYVFNAPRKNVAIEWKINQLIMPHGLCVF